MPWLLWIIPQWMWVCRGLFKTVISFPLDLYPEGWMLDHMVALFFIFSWPSTLYSIVVIPIYKWQYSLKDKTLEYIFGQRLIWWPENRYLAFVSDVLPLFYYCDRHTHVAFLKCGLLPHHLFWSCVCMALTKACFFKHLGRWEFSFVSWLIG